MHECTIDEIIKLQYVFIEDNTAYVFTNPLKRLKFERFRKFIEVLPY